jgi:glycosyltransferase involved in cell wall biosynthesis
MWAFIDRTQTEQIERWGHRGADAVIAEAGHVARDLVQRLGVPAAKVRVRRNGVDTNRFRPRPADAALLRELQIGEGVPVILTVARLEAMKNHDFLLRAFSRMARNAALVIVGKGGEADRLKQFASDLGIASRVRFTGFRSDVDRFYSIASTFVLPSIYEPYGNVFSEALACGLPTIGLRPSDKVCVPSDEHIVEGENGFLVEDGDERGLATQLDQLISDPGLRGRLSRTAIEIAKVRYDWAATAREFLDEFVAGQARNQAFARDRRAVIERAVTTATQ